MIRAGRLRTFLNVMATPSGIGYMVLFTTTLLSANAVLWKVGLPGWVFFGIGMLYAEVVTKVTPYFADRAIDEAGVERRSIE